MMMMADWSRLSMKPRRRVTRIEICNVPVFGSIYFPFPYSVHWFGVLRSLLGSSVRVAYPVEHSGGIPLRRGTLQIPIRFVSRQFYVHVPISDAMGRLLQR